MLTDSTATFGAGTVAAGLVVAGSCALAMEFGATVVGAAVVGAAVVGAIVGGTLTGGIDAGGYCAEAGDAPSSATAMSADARAPAGKSRSCEREFMSVTIGVCESELQAENPRRVLNFSVVRATALRRNEDLSCRGKLFDRAHPDERRPSLRPGSPWAG